MKRQVWIADFGSQYTQLITRKTRELGYSSEIYTVKQVKEKLAAGEKPVESMYWLITLELHVMQLY